MEFIRTKINGATINAIYNGGNYYFYSDWYGLIVIATRKELKKEFNLIVDNGAVLGGCPRKWERMAKRVINKSENKYIECTVSYTVTQADLSRTHLSITTKSI